MNEATKKILNDLKNAGLNTSSIEQQLNVNPILDKQTDAIIGAGVLRQADYTRYMQQTQAKENELNQKINELATLHDAAKVSALPQEALDAIDKMEKALIETNLYDEESIKSVSFVGKQALTPLINQPPQNTPAPINSNIPKETEMDTSKFVDVDMFQRASANLVYGNAAINAKVTAAIRRAEKLGIEVTDEMLDSFHANMIDGVERKNLSIDQVIDKQFKISETQKVRDQENFQKQLKDAEAKGRADALKENNIPARNVRFSQGRHMILDRKSLHNENPPAPVNGENPPKETTPQNPQINKPGHVNGVPIYQMRGSREDRMIRAAESNARVEEYLANDPTYVP